MRIGTLVLAACAMAGTGSLEKVPPPSPVRAEVQTVDSAPVEKPAPPAPAKRRIAVRGQRSIVQAPIADQPETASETFVVPDQAPLEQLAQEVSEPIAEQQPQPPVEKKQHFWNKLNPFKKHKAEPSR